MIGPKREMPFAEQDIFEPASCCVLSRVVADLERVFGQLKSQTDYRFLLRLRQAGEKRRRFAASTGS